MERASTSSFYMVILHYYFPVDRIIKRFTQLLSTRLKIKGREGVSGENWLIVQLSNADGFGLEFHENTKPKRLYLTTWECNSTINYLFLKLPLILLILIEMATCSISILTGLLFQLLVEYQGLCQCC